MKNMKPMLLTNNQRKMHGLPLWRKKNRKKRLYTRCEADETSSTCHYMQEMREMGLIISGPEFSPRAFTLPGAKYVFDDDLEGGTEA